jgi:hypothetical protein
MAQNMAKIARLSAAGKRIVARMQTKARRPVQFYDHTPSAAKDIVTNNYKKQTDRIPLLIISDRQNRISTRSTDLA